MTSTFQPAKPPQTYCEFDGETFNFVKLNKYRCAKETGLSPRFVYIFSSSSELTSQTLFGPSVLEFIDETTRAPAVLVGAFLWTPTELANGVFGSFEFKLPLEVFASFLAFFLVEDTMISFRQNCHMWLSIPQRLQSFFRNRASHRV